MSDSLIYWFWSIYGIILGLLIGFELNKIFGLWANILQFAVSMLFCWLGHDWSKRLKA